MPSVSGTLGTQVFDVNRIIESAYKRCRIPPSALTGEQVEDAVDLLGIFLATLPSKGPQLWTLEPVLLGMRRGRPTVTLPVGTVEARTVNYREIQRLSGTLTSVGGGTVANLADGDLETACTHTSPSGYVDYDFGEPVAINVVGFVMNAALTASLKFLTSNDGTTWRERIVYDANCAYAEGEWVWRELAETSYARYARLQEVGTATLDLAEWVVASSGTSIPLTRINVDTYRTMPNKFTEGRPVNYYMTRTHERFSLNLWPAPGLANQVQCLEVLRKRLIMDVGRMTNLLEIPLTWYEAIIAGLAERIAVADEKVQPNLIPVLKGEAKAALDFALNDQRDPSPIVFRPDISRYTR